MMVGASARLAPAYFRPPSGGSSRRFEVGKRVRLAATALGAALAAGTSVVADPPPLKPELSGLGFLLGSWSSPRPGALPETGGASSGAMMFTPDAGGAVILRKDHVVLSDSRGRAAGGFDILMMVYAEDGAIRAEYADGTHVIHYSEAKIDPGRSVEFTAPARSGGPGFQLIYALERPGRISVRFSMAPPGQSAYRPIATGVADKDL